MAEQEGDTQLTVFERRMERARAAIVELCVSKMSLLVSEKELIGVTENGKQAVISNLFRNSKQEARALGRLKTAGFLVTLEQFGDAPMITDPPQAAPPPLTPRVSEWTSVKRRAMLGVTPLVEARDYIVDRVRHVMGYRENVYVVESAVQMIAETTLKNLRADCRPRVQSRKGLIPSVVLTDFYNTKISHVLTRDRVLLYIRAQGLVQTFVDPLRPESQLIRLMDRVEEEALINENDIEYAWYEMKIIRNKERIVDLQKDMESFKNENKASTLEMEILERLEKLTAELIESFKEHITILRKLLLNLDRILFLVNPEDVVAEVMDSVILKSGPMNQNFVRILYSPISPHRTALRNMFHVVWYAMRRTSGGPSYMIDTAQFQQLNDEGQLEYNKESNQRNGCLKPTLHLLNNLFKLNTKSSNLLNFVNSKPGIHFLGTAIFCLTNLILNNPPVGLPMLANPLRILDDPPNPDQILPDQIVVGDGILLDQVIMDDGIVPDQIVMDEAIFPVQDIPLLADLNEGNQDLADPDGIHLHPANLAVANPAINDQDGINFEQNNVIPDQDNPVIDINPANADPVNPVNPNQAPNIANPDQGIPGLVPPNEDNDDIDHQPAVDPDLDNPHLINPDIANEVLTLYVLAIFAIANPSTANSSLINLALTYPELADPSFFFTIEDIPELIDLVPKKNRLLMDTALSIHVLANFDIADPE